MTDLWVNGHDKDEDGKLIGKDTNPGTEDKPLLTISRAVEIIGEGGGTVYFDAGDIY